MTITWDDEAPAKSSGSLQWDDDESLASKGKDLGMHMLGGAEATLEAIPKMIAGMVGQATGMGAEALSRGVEGLSSNPYMKSTVPTLEGMMQKGGEQAKQFTDWRLLEQSRPSEEAINKGFEQGIEKVGEIGENLGMSATHSPLNPANIAAYAADPQHQLSSLSPPVQPGEGMPGVRGAAEVATQMAPIVPVIKGVGLGKMPFTGEKPFIKSAEPTTNPLEYEPGPQRSVIKTGQRDTRTTETQIPPIEPDVTGAYTYKNKEVTQKFEQYDIRKGSDIPGIDFTKFSLEDPKQLEHLQTQLGELGITSNLAQSRQLAAEMKEKMAVADERVKGLPQTITKQIAPTAVPTENVIRGYKQINASPMNAHVELVDTRLMELMRDHDRLTEPKSEGQFLQKENSVLENGVHKGLTLHYWPEENRIVQVNGNTRRGVAAKHGMQEIPAYVRIMPGKIPEEWQRTAVSIPGLHFEGKAEGQFAKPSDVGLPSRTLNEGVFEPKVKYAPNPTVDTVRIPAGQFHNNYLSNLQHNEMPTYGARPGLSIVRDTSSIPFYKELSKLLLDDKTFNPEFAVREKDDAGYRQPTGSDLGTGGQYRPKDYEMSVRRDLTGNEYVFMHEAVHARLHSLMETLISGKMDRMHPSYDATKRMVELWQSLRTSAEIEGPGASPLAKVGAQYGMSVNGQWHDAPHEYVSEAMTNPEFQNLLKQISLPDHMQGKGFSYYWDAFIQKAASMLGLRHGQNSYLAATFSAAAEMMRTSNKQDRMFYALEQKPDSWYPRAVGMEGKAEFMESVLENKKLMGIDRRPLDQVVKEGQHTAETFKDLDSGDTGNLFQMLWGKTKLFGRQLVEERTIQKMNETTPGAGDILKNIGDRTFLTDRWVIGQIAETMKGKELTPGATGRFVHRLGSRDGIDPTFQRLGDEASSMLKKWLPASGGKDYLTRSSFDSDKQWQGYNVIQNQVQRVAGIINDLRTKVGKPLIEPLKNFFPFSRPVGDYRVLIKDNMGNIRNVETFQRASPLQGLNGLYDANKYVAKMKELFPYMEVSEPMHVDRTHLRDLDGKILTELEKAIKKQETDYEVWAEGERINTGDNELSKLIQKAKTEHFTKMGMGGHLIERKKGEQIGGYLGSDFNPEKAREGLQQYFENAYQYAGNLQKSLIEKELNGLEIPDKEGKTQTLSQVAPNLDKYLHQVLDLSKGKKNVMDMSEQIFLGELTHAFGEGRSAPTRQMASISRLAMVWYLFKPSFFGTQPIQTMNALAHLTELTGSPIKSVGHYLTGIQSAMSPSIADKAGVNWAVKNGLIDPGTSHLLDDYNSSVPTRLFLKMTGTIEREAVRIPVFLMFEHALRDTISNPEKRYEVAAEKMAYSMSMVNRTNQPLIWSKLGIIGQGMRQLKSYSTNIWGQFAYFMNLAADQGKYKPLATFIGTGVLVGGIKGTIGVAEATAIITGINYMTNSNIQTPTEWFLKKGASTGLVYGMASTATGRDISNQVGNPSGFSYLDPIPFKFAYDIGKANLEYAIAVGQGQLTDDIRLKTWLANTPPYFHEMIKNWLTKPGQPVPTPGAGGRGAYFRDEQQTIVSSASGTKSIEETKADDLQRFFKQHEQRLVANKSQIQNSMVDDLFNGKGFDPSKIQEYIAQGGSIESLQGDLKNTLIERHRSAIFNSIVNTSKSPAQASRLREVQPYLQNQPSNIYNAPKSGTLTWDKEQAQ